MGTSQAIYAGWMELPNSAVTEQARTEQEEAALAALVSQYSGTLYRVAYSVLRNSSDAEDAVQEAFLRVLRHRATLHEVRDYRVWLIRIVWNVVLDRKRRSKTRPETDDIADLARVLPDRKGTRQKSAPPPRNITPMCWPAWTSSHRKSARFCCSQLLKNYRAWRLPECWALRNRVFALACSVPAT